MVALLLILTLAVAIPLFVTLGSTTIKVIQLLFFTKAGVFPLWALFVIIIVGYILIKKARRTGYGHYIP